MSQLELFAQSSVAVSAVPTAESVRARLEAVLALLRVASELPWSPREAARWKVIVPQMVDWLPPEEQEAVRMEFAVHVQRLEIAA